MAYINTSTANNNHAYNITIDYDVGAQGHGKYFVDGQKSINKNYIYILMDKEKFPGSSRYYNHVAVHKSTNKEDVSLER